MENKFIAKCTSLNEYGQGVVNYNNSTFIVDNLLVNEEAELIITKKTRNYYLARIHRLIKKSNERNEVKCNSKCGGCNLIHLNYDKQIEFKNKLFHELFKEYKVNNLIKADNNYYYRNKVIYALNYTKDNIYFGLYEEDTHKVIDASLCLVNNKNSLELMKLIKEYLLNNNIKSVKYILFRFNSFNDVLVGLITNNDLINEEELINLLKDKVTSIIINYNDFTTNKILGESNKVIYGNNIIKEKIGKYYFNISLNSFFQINYSQMIKLYNLVKESNLINKEDILLDAYSGTSTIGIYLSDKVKKVISVESNTSSYLNALDNVKLNNVNNLECINEDCTKYINETNDHFSVVVMDPPRSGCSFSFLNALINKKVSKLIYVSCNPKTLKRDLNILKEYYDILSITPLDMFPNTLHIETVVELKRKDELDIIANKIMNKHIEAFKELAK